MAENSQPPNNDNQQEIEELISSLPKEKWWRGSGLTLYQNFWVPSDFIRGVITLRRHFIGRDSNILLASKPKTGTTWLKALAFSVLHRAQFRPSVANANHPLCSSNPHDLVPFLEIMLNGQPAGHVPDMSGFTDLQLFATHVPYHFLPESIHQSQSRVIYICRNPLDTALSSWHFWAQANLEGGAGDWSMEEFFENFCKGLDFYGPFWDHLLSYWKASCERPERVLFLKYEDLKEDTARNLKRIAEFMGVPFSKEEELDGVVDQIVEMCSLSNLKELDVNKTGDIFGYENKTFFRKGEVGDWANYLSPSMVERLENIMKEKFSPFGLYFTLKKTS
ncbi:cytosolic sulfotransferase 15-like isoform X1 [Punica granatum]|uniref:Sulfotransferase n=1 Tax=Punica granatum TaxID=22663 RepID=A0A6P8BNJ9_PUNGR|nr:cytosolic sulfotransferase 15-like isoform X1 [Punica granatum]